MTTTIAKFKCPFTEAVINFEEDPYIPEGWTLSCPKKNERRKIKLCFVEFELFSTEQQKAGVSVDEEQFYTELPKDGACPANLLDHFLKFSEDIPEEFIGKEETKYIFFPGSVYLDENLQHCFRGIFLEKETEEWKECKYTFYPSDMEKDTTWLPNFVALIMAA